MAVLNAAPAPNVSNVSSDVAVMSRGRSWLRVVIVVGASIFALAGQGARADGLSAEAAFLACAGCHSREPGAPHGVGPNLHDLAGRPAASAEGFAYSPALRESSITWNEGTLTAWIVATESMVPGTWMLYHNHLEAEEVGRLVAYLLKTPRSDEASTIKHDR